MRLKKIMNVFMSYFGYLLSIITHKPHCYGMPFLFSIEPTSFCNLHCPQCPSGTGLLSRRKSTMDIDSFHVIINKINNYAIYASLYLQGEPFLNKDFCEMIEYAHENDIYTSTSTNGQLLNESLADRIVESGLDKIIVSVDGATQSSYEKYRVGGKLEKALNASELLANSKKKLGKDKPFIEMQMLVFRHNEGEINEMKQLAKLYGADKLTLKSAQIYDYKNGNTLMPTSSKFSRYIKESDGTYKLKRTLHNRCARIFTAAAITIDGDVIPCSFDKNADHSFGNINKQSLEEIWHSKKANEFRSEVLCNRKRIGICTNCVY